MLARKEALGRAASFRTLAEKTGLPSATIYAVITERDTRIPISADKSAEVLSKASRALDEIEAQKEAA